MSAGPAVPLACCGHLGFRVRKGSGCGTPFCVAGVTVRLTADVETIFWSVDSCSLSPSACIVLLMPQSHKPASEAVGSTVVVSNQEGLSTSWRPRCWGIHAGPRLQALVCCTLNPNP